MTINAQGFAPYETVTFVLHSAPVTLGTAVADAHGDVSNAVFTIPSGTALGDHAIVATGATSTIAKVLGVTLTTAAPPANTADLASTGARAGVWLSQAAALLSVGAIALMAALRRRRLRG